MIIRYIIGLIAGIALLIWSADIFVGNAARLARRCGISAFIVGMFVIGFGTSLPEMLVSLFSAIEGSPSIALGNAYGSNIANILLILGLTAAFRPVAVADAARRRDIPLLLSVTLLAGALLADGDVSRSDSILMLAFFAAFCARNAVAGKVAPADADDGNEIASDHERPLWKMIIGVTAGLVLVVASSRILVVSAVGLARALGVSDLVIGLTVVAIGTSLPELASSVAAIRQGENDLALGNVVGSNFFNTLAVVGIAGATRPIDGDAGAAVIGTVLRRDYPTMTGATLLLLLFCIKWGGKNADIGRAKGVVFLVLYAGYMAFLARGAIA